MTELSSFERLVARIDAAVPGSPASDTCATGFPSIDSVLGGGVRQGDLVVIGGAVGSGKSSLALAIALRMAATGTSALFLTHEMSAERVLERALAMEGRCRIDDLRSGTLNDASRAQVDSAAARLRDRSPQIGVLGAGGVEGLAGTLRKSADLKVAFVDPLQVLAVGERPQEEDLATATRALKRFAVELGVAVVATSHVRGAAGGRVDPRPVLDDFGALGAIEQEADVILGLFREEMFHPDSGVDGATELRLLKNRNGNTGYVDLYFYKQWLRFEDMLDPGK